MVPLPALWLISWDFEYLLVVQLATGFSWAAVEYATMLWLFEGIEERVRASVLTGFNLANGLMVALGSLAGAALFNWLEGTTWAYALLFIVSSVARCASLALIFNASVPKIGWHAMAFRTLAIRPSAGCVQRPILAVLTTLEAAGEREKPLP